MYVKKHVMLTTVFTALITSFGQMSDAAEVVIDPDPAPAPAPETDVRGAFEYETDPNKKPTDPDYETVTGLSAAAYLISSLSTSQAMSKLSLLDTLPIHRNTANYLETAPDRLSFFGESAKSYDLWVRYMGAWSDDHTRLHVSDLSGKVKDDGKMNGIQTGIDIILDNGVTLTMAGHYANEKHKISARDRDGKSGHIHTNNYGLAMGATYEAASGFYTFGQASWGHLDTKIRTSREDTHGKTNGNAVLLSTGLGKIYSLQNGLSIVPELRYCYYNLKFDSFSASHDNRFSSLNFDNSDLSLEVDLNKVFAFGSGHMILQSSVGVAHVFGNNESTNLAGVSVSGTVPTDDFASASAGFVYQLAGARKTRLWANVKHRMAIDNGHSHATRVNAGVSMSF